MKRLATGLSIRGDLMEVELRENDRYLLGLSLLQDIGRKKLDAAIKVLGSPRNLFNSSDKTLSELNIFEDEDIQRFCRFRLEYSFERETLKLSEAGCTYISRESELFPERLKYVNNSPYGIFIKGEVAYREDIPSVAIVGARSCSSYGGQIARKIASELSAAGVQIISGLATGIDSFSHQGALDGDGTTFAVLGNGVDICYPSGNLRLYDNIQLHGAVISEYPLGMRARQWCFPMRNRIISGLSDIVIIVEAREKSGSLITAEYALEQGKDIFAVPGRLGDKLSEGCNHLIKAGAGIYLDTEDIIFELEQKYGEILKFSKKNKYALEKDLEVVYSCLDLLPKNIHTIIEETGETYEYIFDKLVNLEMLNLVVEPVRGYYVKNIN